MRQVSRRKGFTLIELLVVIAVIVVLIALILPAVLRSREKSRRSQCQNNLQKIGVALLNYHVRHNSFPQCDYWEFESGPTIGTNVQPRCYTWICMILPDLDQGSLYHSINFRLPGMNQVINGKALQSYTFDSIRCPSDPGFGGDTNRHNIGWTNYCGAEGYDWWRRPHHPLSGMFNLNMHVRLDDVKDGKKSTIHVMECSTSGFYPEAGVPGHHHNGGGVPRSSKWGAGESVFHTALTSYGNHPDVMNNLSESGGRGAPHPDGTRRMDFWGPWTAPYAYHPGYIHCFGVNNNWPGASSVHDGGAYALMADGSVHFINESIDYPGENTNGWTEGSGVWGALNTYAGTIPSSKTYNPWNISAGLKAPDSPIGCLFR